MSALIEAALRALDHAQDAIDALYPEGHPAREANRLLTLELEKLIRARDEMSAQPRAALGQEWEEHA